LAQLARQPVRLGAQPAEIVRPCRHTPPFRCAALLGRPTGRHPPHGSSGHGRAD
jgi:hypothetical protein